MYSLYSLLYELLPIDNLWFHEYFIDFHQIKSTYVNFRPFGDYTTTESPADFCSIWIYIENQRKILTAVSMYCTWKRELYYSRNYMYSKSKYRNRMGMQRSTKWYKDCHRTWLRKYFSGPCTISPDHPSSVWDKFTSRCRGCSLPRPRDRSFFAVTAAATATPPEFLLWPSSCCPLQMFKSHKFSSQTTE